MNLHTTKVYEEILEAYFARKGRILLEGGTSGSKTYSALQVFIMLAKYDREPTISSVVSESLPHLKKGAIRDFFNILGEYQNNNKNYNKSDCVYTFPGSNSIIEFFGADESGKVEGPRRRRLFINEGINIPWETARNLDIRTSGFVMVDWNPYGEFWVHEYESGGKVIPGWLKQSGNAYSHSTYLDAIDVLSAEVVAKIEAGKNDPNWWNVYGLGLLGKIEGLVYPSFQQERHLPRGDEFYGLDFGFSIHPTTLIKSVLTGKEIHSQQLIYETDLTNDAIATRMEELGIRKNYDQIWADSAEPKSIAEIHALGFNIQGAKKGPGSVAHRIQLMNQYKQFWTQDSVESIKEQRNCRFITDKNGKLTNKITHQWTHAMDGRDYGLVGYMTEPVEQTAVYDSMVEVNDLDLEMDLV